MSIVVDYANWRPPSAQALVNAGVVGVYRYIKPARFHWPKAITAHELTDLHSVHLGVAFNYENNPDDWRTLPGATTGSEAATAMAELGMGDPTIPVAPSFDEYINPNSYGSAAAYADAFHKACGHRTAAYGQGDLLEFLHARGLADFCWQSNSTSFPGNGAATPHTTLTQHYGWPVPGLPGDYDVNTIIQTDWGQTPRPTPPAPKPEVKVHPRFNPPLDNVVDAYDDATDLWLLGQDGGVFTDKGTFYGSFVGDPHFAGQTAARLVAPNTVVTDGTIKSTPAFDEAHAGYKMIVVAESAMGAGAGRFGLPKGGK